MRADQVIVAVAARQKGVITIVQLLAAGFSHDAVAHRVKRGWLRRLHRGVYLVGPLEVPLSRPMAAVLAAGRGALLSHHPAAVLWGQRQPRDEPMHVTVIARDVRIAELNVHRIAHLHRQDATRHHGIPVTSPARTLLDLATTVTQRDLARATEEAQVQRRVSTHSLNEQFRRYPTHRGAAALRRAIRTDPALTRSEAERRLLGLIRAARLPAPTTNAQLHGYEVDFLWRDHNLVVEVDGYAFHSSRSSFERDRRRDRDLQSHSYRVIRFTWREITEEPEAVIAALAAALTRRAGALR
jgi:very-short-patch-repair endonuclease